MLIYPTLNVKERKEEPFISLINRFLEFLKGSDIFIIIGFSFRDKDLVNYIKLHFKNKLLIIIDPNPFESLRNFFQPNNKDIKGIKHQDIDLFSYQKDDYKFVLIKEFFNESNIEKIIKKLEYVIIENSNPHFWSIKWVA